MIYRNMTHMNWIIGTQWRQVATADLDNIGSGIGLLAWNITPLPQSTMTYLAAYIQRLDF